MARKATIKLRQDTYENFEADASGDGILQGEVVYLTDKKALVVGDGINGVAGHPTIIPVGNYHNTEVDGWTVSKDNGDVERKFWKDDFSVDTKELYAGDAYFTLDTTNSRITYTSAIAASNKRYYVADNVKGDGKYSLAVSHEAEPSDWLMAGIAFCIQPSDPSAYYNAVIINYTVGQDKIYLYRTSSGSRTSIGSADINVVLGTFYRLDVVKEGSSIKVYVDGILKITATDSTYSSGYFGMFASTSGSTTGTSTAYFKDFSYAPTESYADDFATDTVTGANGRYQAVTGTVAYDDVNKRMNVTTATGANGKASGRLKSYKFTEGSQIYDVTLPTGVDGDFITLVTHSANGLMTDGIGVGLQSDGAGNWNLATLSNTTVTVGASSGLVDGKTARIEIEKDLSGAYWYYIYDAAGAKPTTATGKLFTTRTEGYTGWYANGAGATTQTYAIDNITIRAESIVGRTNVQVEEPFWFRDEFSENSLGRWAGDVVHFSVVDGDLQTQSSSRTIYIPVAKLKDIDTSVNWTPTADGQGLLRCSLIVGHNGVSFYNIYLRGDTRGYTVYNRSNEELTSGTWTTPIVSGGTYSLRAVTTGTTCSVYIDAELVVTFTMDVESGYVGLRSGFTETAPLSFNQFDNLQITGTRVYNKPIHRGAMLETYHDGTQEVVGTTYLNDMNWNAGELTLDKTTGGSWAIDTVNGVLSVTTNVNVGSGASFRTVQIVDGYWRFKFNTTSTHLQFGILQQKQITDSSSNTSIHNGGGYIVDLATTISSLYTSTSDHLGSTTVTYVAGTTYLCEVLKVGNVITLKLTDPNGAIRTKTWTDASNLFTTSIGVCNFYQHYPETTTKIWDLVAIGFESTSTNGIAACIPPIGGGARYGVQEGASIEFTNKALRGDYDFTTCVKTTVPGAIAHNEMYFGNTTDTSAITEDTTTTKDLLIESASYLDFEKPLVLNYDDRKDTITVGVRKLTDNDPTTYIDFMAVVPTKEVI